MFGSLFASRKGSEDVLRQFEDGTWVLRVSDAVADHEVTAEALVKDAATQPLALMLSIRLAGGISHPTLFVAYVGRKHSFAAFGSSLLFLPIGSVAHSVLALPAADGKVAMRDGQGSDVSTSLGPYQIVHICS